MEIAASSPVCHQPGGVTAVSVTYQRSSSLTRPQPLGLHQPDHMALGIGELPEHDAHARYLTGAEHSLPTKFLRLLERGAHVGHRHVEGDVTITAARRSADSPADARAATAGVALGETEP